jgi:hypothetical protein
MSAHSQFALFCICIGAGFVFGIAYEPISLLRSVFKRSKWVGITLDILFFIALALWYTGAIYLFQFPSFRLYYWLGFLVGGIIYLKSLHIILAFFKKICYNKFVKIAKKLKNRKKIGKKEI